MTRWNTPDPVAGYGVRPPPSGVQPIGLTHPQFPHMVRVAAFLDWIGVHRFDLGRNGSGIADLILFWTGIPGMIALVACILFALSSERDFNLTYNYAPAATCSTVPLGSVASPRGPVRLPRRAGCVLAFAGAALLLAACSAPARNDGLPDRGGFEYKRRILSF